MALRARQRRRSRYSARRGRRVFDGGFGHPGQDHGQVHDPGVRRRGDVRGGGGDEVAAALQADRHQRGLPEQLAVSSGEGAGRADPPDQDGAGATRGGVAGRGRARPAGTGPSSAGTSPRGPALPGRRRRSARAWGCRRRAGTWAGPCRGGSRWRRPVGWRTRSVALRVVGRVGPAAGWAITTPTPWTGGDGRAVGRWCVGRPRRRQPGRRG